MWINEAKESAKKLTKQINRKFKNIRSADENK
jgi:uncharacterized lipoprotein YehR (DUF1307 family)